LREITNQRIKLNFIKTTLYWLLFIFFFILPQKSSRWAIFHRHVILHLSIKVDKTCMKIMVWHLTTIWYDPFSRLTPQQLWCRPKKTNLNNHQLLNLTVHDGHFEPIVEILLVYIKGQDLSIKEIKFPFFHPLKIGMNSKQWGEKQSEAKVWKKPTIPLVFIFFSSRQLSPTFSIVSLIPLPLPASRRTSQHDHQPSPC
jgi:hypothetical protein